MTKDKMIVVTGAAGFIGSNMVKLLNKKGYENLILVDDLSDGHKFKNLKGAKFSSYMDKDDFLEWLTHESLEMDPETFLTEYEEVSSVVDCIIHLGATSNTTDWDGKAMMNNNYKYSIDLFTICQNYDINFIYASSASVYGNEIFKDSNSRGIDPLNVYAFSKWCIDQYVIKFFKNHQEASMDQETARRMSGNLDLESLPKMAPVVGLRLFNVYGPGEEFKGGQASPVTKFQNELIESDSIKVFDIESSRDFVYVEDVCETIDWFIHNPNHGIFDVGTGIARSFMDVAHVLGGYRYGSPSYWRIEKIGMPFHLQGNYQYYTRADLEPLRSVGFTRDFLSLEEGVAKCV